MLFPSVGVYILETKIFFDNSYGSYKM